MTARQIVAPPDEQVVTTAEAARQLGVCLRTVQLWCAAGQLRHRLTVGGHRRVLLADIEAMKNNGATLAAPPVAQFAHTASQWHYDAERGVVVTDDQKPIAFVCIYAADSVPQENANGRLMADAPELLSLLIAARPFVPAADRIAIDALVKRIATPTPGASA